MKMILAADEKWGIARNGNLLCHLPGDLKHFKEQTLGKTLIMGRVTLESLPGKKGLPGRRNLVLTRNPNYQAQDAEVVHNRRELIQAVAGLPEDDIIVMGGEKVYRDFLPECDTCIITKIQGDLKADQFFVDLDQDPDFEKEEILPAQEENGISYRVFQYTRKTGY